MKIVFFGSSKHILPTIEVLQKGFDLALVVTTEKKETDAVPSFCTQKNIPYLSVINLKDPKVLDRIRQIQAQVGVLGYFGLIVPQELLTIFPKGIVNIHPSLLPLYRGPTPVQTALLNGDTETGVTIIILDNEIDHGPVLAQEKTKIDSSDTTASLHDRLFKTGARLIEEVLPKYLNGEISPIEQDHSDANFTKQLSKSDGQFDISNPPEKSKLNRMIRAYYPWPGVWTKLRIKKQELRIKFLPEQKLQVEGGKPMSIKDFINGYPEMKEIIQQLGL